MTVPPNLSGSSHPLAWSTFSAGDTRSRLDF